MAPGKSCNWTSLGPLEFLCLGCVAAICWAPGRSPAGWGSQAQMLGFGGEECRLFACLFFGGSGELGWVLFCLFLSTRWIFLRVEMEKELLRGRQVLIPTLRPSSAQSVSAPSHPEWLPRPRACPSAERCFPLSIFRERL